jgi:capsular polysaccharide biosynthesis protein
MEIKVTHKDPRVAAKIVEQIAEIAPDKIVDAVEAGSCKVVSDVEATKYPVSPSTMKNTAIAAMLGLMLSAGLVILKALFRNYIEDDADVAKHLGLPVLGVIPEVEDLA